MKSITLTIILIAILIAAGLSGCMSIEKIAATEYPEGFYSVDEVELNGTKQWIYVRSLYKSKPVLLWLDGGPGGSEMGWAQYYNKSLEEHFTFVNWDQRGTAKSFYAVKDWNDVSVDDYINDIIDLSEYLCRRFNQQKIFLVGHSWGTIIGLMAASKRPDLFYAYTGVAQQVNSGENDNISYNIVLDGLTKAGDRNEARTLLENGRPPYPKGETGKYMFLFRRIYKYMPRGEDMGETDGLRLFNGREHNLIDKFNMLRGLTESLNYVYPQLDHLDFEKTIPQTNLPVYFALGRYDYACVQSIAERYFNNLIAPKKN